LLQFSFFSFHALDEYTHAGLTCHNYYIIA